MHRNNYKIIPNSTRKLIKKNHLIPEIDQIEINKP